MHSTLRCALAAALLAAAAQPVAAQQTSAATATTAPLAADILKDLRGLESKMLGLARAIPADKYGWRPAEGVRSVSEVLLHVAADNYFLPAAIGFAPDPKTGIKGDDFKTTQTFEKRTVSRDSTIAELERSFAFLKKSLAATTADKLGTSVSMFGQSFTQQQLWILTATHLHEHLGQMIAYARSNGVKPPWGQGG